MDKDNLDSIIASVSKTIFSYCLSRTGNRYDAEDLSQDIIVEIYRSYENIRDEKAFYGFMWGVAGNIYKRWLTKKACKREVEIDETVCETPWDGDILPDNSDIFLLRRELSLLNEKYRRAAILYYIEEKPCAEIAKILKESESMVKYLLFKTRNIIREGFIMERNYGEQSYSPKSLYLLYFGEGPNKFGYMVQGNTIRQNILWACYNDALTESEISLQLGVALPYLENDLKTLEEAGLINRQGRKYNTNIILISDECNMEIQKKTQVFQKEIAEQTYTFICENQQKIRDIGFLHCDMSQNSLIMQISEIILLESNSTFTSCNDAPVTAFGEKAFVWGVESIKGTLNVCQIDSNMGLENAKIQFMDWTPKPKSELNLFYGNRKLSKRMVDIACGKGEGDNDFEKELTAELLKKDYVIKKDGKLIPTLPVYRESEIKALMDVIKPVFEQNRDISQKIADVTHQVIREHTPVKLKKQTGRIADMAIWNPAIYNPLKIMSEKGYFSTDWTAGETPTAYIILY